MALEFRDYQGDFEDIVDLAYRVWVPEYGGKTWIPLPEAAFLRDKLAPENGAACPVAYEGTRLVGCVFSVPRLMRVGDTMHEVSMFTGFTVEPGQRRVALPLIERLRRANEERGVAFGVGMVLDDPSSASYRFWTKYAEAFPNNFRFVFRGGYWAKFLATDAVARAGIETWERAACRVFGPILRFTPFGYDRNVRPYRPADLPRCIAMLEKTSAGIDWAMCWPAEQLGPQLGGTEFTTFVYERDGKMRGMVNSHCFTLYGREKFRCAFIDLWAEDDIIAIERVRLIAHLCTYLRERNVHAIVAARSATMPNDAFLANLFVPGAQHFRIGIFPTKSLGEVPPPKTWSFEIT